MLTQATPTQTTPPPARIIPGGGTPDAPPAGRRLSPALAAYAGHLATIARVPCGIVEGLLVKIGQPDSLHAETLEGLIDLGVSPTHAHRLIAALALIARPVVVEPEKLNRPDHIARYLMPEWGYHGIEKFGIVCLSTRNRPLGDPVLISQGSLSATVVHPREVFRPAILRRASGIVIFHNHPSGDPTPSEDDMALTTRMVRAGEIVGIGVLDHLILAKGNYYSLLEAGRMPR